MKISLDEVRHVAQLARLDLSPEEIERMAGDLSAILDYVAKLDEVDTERVEPTSHVVAMKVAYRDDSITNEPAPERMLANAPRREKDYFVVPTIIE